MEVVGFCRIVLWLDLSTIHLPISRNSLISINSEEVRKKGTNEKKYILPPSEFP